MEKMYAPLEIPRCELFPEDILTDPTYVTLPLHTTRDADPGVVNQQGIAALRQRMPYYDLASFEKNPRVCDFGQLMTVGDLKLYLEFKGAEFIPSAT